MSNLFTLRNWSTHAWQMYPLAFIAWASIWQLIDATELGRAGVSVANLVGINITMVGLHLRNRPLGHAIERWGYVCLIWSLSCYLALALHHDGWWGLVHQTNFGVVLPMAVIFAAFHRMVWTALAPRLKRRKIHNQTQILMNEVYPNRDHSDKLTG